MPKQKTTKTISKRFKITGSGKLMRMAQNDQHRKFHKSSRLVQSYHRHRVLGNKETKLVKRFLA